MNTAFLKRTSRTLALIVSLAFAAACSTVVPSPQGAVPAKAEAETAWARVLEQFVNARGEVDFAALAADRSDLDRYVRFIAQPANAIPADPAVRLAHLINSYNALSMYNVIESGIPATHAGWAKVRFFVLRKLRIDGEDRSLYSYENDVIRPLGEPRIHFALNCSAVACPVLPMTPFTAAGLDDELQRETLSFFAMPRNFRIDHENRTVWLSELLDFFAEDFVPAAAPSLLEYANRYAPVPAPLDYTVRFTPYDWTIANSRRSLQQD